MSTAQSKSSPAARRARFRVFFASYCIIGAVLIFLFTKGSSEVSTPYGHVTSNQYQIASQVPGRVVEVLAQDNQAVKEGDVLVRLDEEPFQAAVALAEGSLAAAKAIKQVAEAKLAQLEFQKVQIAKAYDENRGAVSLNRLEASRNLYDTGVSAVEQAEAAVEIAEAALATARRHLGYCTIVAPAGGFITQKNIEVGNFLKPQQPLMAISSLDNVWIVALFREPDIDRIANGQRATLTLAAYPDQPLTGVVESIESGTQDSVSLFATYMMNGGTGYFSWLMQRVPVKILIQDYKFDPDQPLLLGLNTDVVIDNPNPSNKFFN